jgi:hypothetical protein
MRHASQTYLASVEASACDDGKPSVSPEHVTLRESFKQPGPGANGGRGGGARVQRLTSPAASAARRRPAATAPSSTWAGTIASVRSPRPASATNGLGLPPDPRCRLYCRSSSIPADGGLRAQPRRPCCGGLHVGEDCDGRLAQLGVVPHCLGCAVRSRSAVASAASARFQVARVATLSVRSPGATAQPTSKGSGVRSELSWKTSPRASGAPVSPRSR